VMGLLDSTGHRSGNDFFPVYCLRRFGKHHAQLAGHPVDRTLSWQKRSGSVIPSPRTGARSTHLVCVRPVASPVLRLVAVGVPTLLGLATIAFAFPVVGVIGSFVAGFGEELGWRGFALPRMQARQSALAASLLLGVLWGLWHLPLLVAQGLPLAGAGLIGLVGFVLAIPVPFAVLFTWVYNNTNGSLFLMVLFHTVLDLVGWTILAPSQTWIVPVLQLFLTWVVVAIIVVMAGPARLARRSSV